MRTQEAWILLASLIGVTLLGVFDHELWTPDEPRDAEISREMHLGGFGATPTLNGAPFLEKPPLYYWSVAAAYGVFGVKAWVCRVPSVLFGWGTLAWTALLGRRLLGPGTGLRCALVLATLAVFFEVAHKCQVDSALACMTTGAFTLSYIGFTRKEGKSGAYLGAYLMALLAFLTKGLIGPGILAAGFLAFLLLCREPRELFRAQPWLGAALLAAGIGAWMACLSPENRREFWWTNHLGRFLGVGWTGGHVQPPYYYATALLYSLAPWTLVLPAALAWAWNRMESTPRRFLLAWIGAGVLILSLATTKRETYLLPLLPPFAILVAGWLGRPGDAPGWGRVLFRLLAGLIVLAYAGVLTAAACFGNILGLLLGVALGAAYARALPGKSGAIVLPALTALVVASALLAFVPVAEPKKSLAPFSRALPPIDPIPAFQPDEMTLAMIPFYTGRRVKPVETLEEARTISRSRPAYLVVVHKRREEDFLDRLSASFPYRREDQELLGTRRMVLLSTEPR
jgi:4-amino-4-deoxy-L-arabinose transferase-like glycosyltransferase